MNFIVPLGRSMDAVGTQPRTCICHVNATGVAQHNNVRGTSTTCSRCACGCNTTIPGNQVANRDLARNTPRA